MQFGDNMHVWWNDEQMLARHQPDPFLGESDSVLWTSEDIKGKFKSVKIVDDKHVVVNRNLFLNTHFPTIEKI